MSSDESSGSLQFQECVLKCKEAKQYFDFPTKPIMRTVWLYRLGLVDDFLPKPTACDRHFSEKMFDSNNKLKAIAVPDINLPNELPIKRGATDGIKAIPPTQPSRRGNATKKITKHIDISNVQSNKSQADQNSSHLATNTNTTQSIGNTSSSLSWIDDSSNILVDYRLKVGGRHLCDVIEIPQFIVVFTVVKAKQTNIIQLSDIKKNKNKVVASKRPPLKSLPKPTAFITIDDDADYEEILPDPVPIGKVPAANTKTLEIAKKKLPTVPNKPLKIVQPEFSAVQTRHLEIEPAVLPLIQNKSLEIGQKEIPAVQMKPQEILQAGLKTVQTKQLEIVRQEYPTIQTTKSLAVQAVLPEVQNKPIEIVQPEPPEFVTQKYERFSRRKRKQEPEAQTVYYTTEEGAAPRRDRSIQVDLSNKRRETGIQCDVQMDNDIKNMSCNGEMYWVQSRLKNKNPQINLHECLVCGEILNNYASKMMHAYGHEDSPSLCSQCGVIFDNQIKLNVHEKTFHSKNLNSWKPQRCPKRNCPKAFRTKNLLIDHIEEHVRTKQHKCNKCLQFFSTSMKLSCHQRALDKCLRTRGWTSRRWTKRI